MSTANIIQNFYLQQFTLFFCFANQESVTVKIWIMNLTIFSLPQNFWNKFYVKLKSVTLSQFPISVLAFSSIYSILDGFGQAGKSKLLKWVQHMFQNLYGAGHTGSIMSFNSVLKNILFFSTLNFPVTPKLYFLNS